MNVINLNGKIMPADEPALLASNRGYRYGDGLFETMKVINEKIILASSHFERLFAGLSLLKFEISELFTAQKLQNEILSLCKRNKCELLARVRLSVFRGNGGLYDEDNPDSYRDQYIIECWPLNESVNKLNENGLVIDIYPEAKKNCDMFSNLKSANFLPYIMAALYAKENKLNDCLVLNIAGHIADATIANIFIIKDEIIMTPALSEGCVNGVMRRYLLEKLQNTGYKIQESGISVSDIEIADEIFLTNVINGIRWVGKFRNNTYTNLQTTEIYNCFIKTIFC
jgi:branched-chain amino acid aminotransferase